MTRTYRLLLLAVLLIAGATKASAQYYEIANQLTRLVSPALSGSMNYKGYVDFSGTAGVGSHNARFLGISTTQGFRYSSWFFMGAGLGIDVAMGAGDTGKVSNTSYGYATDAKSTKAMIPLFSDFRFNIGSSAATSFFADLKIGAAWLLGNGALALSNDAYMLNGTQFYFKPTIGVRMPVNKAKPQQAVNIGVTYQLLTSNNFYYNNGSSTLHNLGATIAFEW